MPQIITTDTELRTLIPNVLATVEGESILYDKLLPFLETAEVWVKSTFTGNATFDELKSLETPDPTRKLLAKLVATEAFMQAIPNLDLVLTPNGFGIVNNSNVAPASKERVERLVTSLETIRDNIIEQLLDILPTFLSWKGITIKKTTVSDSEQIRLARNSTCNGKQCSVTAVKNMQVSEGSWGIGANAEINITYDEAVKPTKITISGYTVYTITINEDGTYNYNGPMTITLQQKEGNIHIRFNGYPTIYPPYYPEDIFKLEFTREETTEETTNEPPTQYHFFTATLFPNINLCNKVGITALRWNEYNRLRSKLMTIENELANTFFSQEQMEDFRVSVVNHFQETPLLVRTVINSIRTLEISILLDNPLHPQTARDIVNVIRQNPDQFPKWHTSQTASLFTPELFINKKSAGGYWF